MAVPPRVTNRFDKMQRCYGKAYYEEVMAVGRECEPMRTLWTD